jgi:beta-glucanase (GH16 family)
MASTRNLGLAVIAAAVLAFAAGFVLPSAASAAPSCGGKIKNSAGSYWQCTFSDDFSGTTVDSSKWIAQRTDTSGYTNGATACFVDSPNNISVSNGNLVLTARKEAAPFVCPDPWGYFATQYTSGMVSSYARFGQAYGRFEVRAKVWSAKVPGLQTSFWLWPSDSSRYGGWPTSGEIDIAELFSQYADRAIPYVHYSPASPDPNVTNNNCLVSNLDAYHTYTLEWTKDTLKIMFDGKTCLIDIWNPASPLAKPAPFDQPFIIALTQALGVGTNNFDPASTPLPASTTIDYVRAWK